MRRSLQTRDADLLYDDYLSRRNRDVGLSNPPETANSIDSIVRRNRPTSRLSVASTSTRRGRDALDGDPLTSVRLLRRQMRRLALRSAVNDQDITSSIARRATRRLGDAETQLEEMQRRRTDAVIRGDTEAARSVDRQMRNLRSKATEDTYGDLLITNRERTPLFGGRNPDFDDDVEYSPERRRIRRRRREDEERRYSPGLIRSPPAAPNPQPFRRSRSGGTPPEARRSPTSGVIRNRRLFETNGNRSSLPPPSRRSVVSSIPSTRSSNRSNRSNRSDRTAESRTSKSRDRKSSVPKRPKTGESGVCPQCFQRNPQFANAETLNSHFDAECPVLSRCEFCDQTVHVAELNDHHLTGCQFVNGQMSPCPNCGLAQFGGDANHPKCPKKLPKGDSAWCPLCSKEVKHSDSMDSWRRHLMDECLNNGRNRQRWSGRRAPTDGASLLGSLNYQQPAAQPTGQMPSNFSTPSNPQNPNAAPKTTPAAGLPPAPISAIGPQPEQLRDAYERLKLERRTNYEKQRAIDEAAAAQKEDEENV